MSKRDLTLYIMLYVHNKCCFTYVSEQNFEPINQRDSDKRGYTNQVALWLTELNITKYGSTLYIGMDEVLAHFACTFENSNLHFHFQ